MIFACFHQTCLVGGYGVFQPEKRLSDLAGPTLVVGADLIGMDFSSARF